MKINQFFIYYIIQPIHSSHGSVWMIDEAWLAKITQFSYILSQHSRYWWLLNAEETRHKFIISEWIEGSYNINNVNIRNGHNSICISISTIFRPMHICHVREFYEYFIRFYIRFVLLKRLHLPCFRRLCGTHICKLKNKFNLLDFHQ